MSIGIKIAIDATRNSSPMTPIVAAYQARVLADGGNIDETQANLVTLLNQLNGVVPNFTNTCKLFVAPHLGNKSATGTGATAGNRAANKLYNIFGTTGDLRQEIAASQPLLLRNTGVNYAYLPGIAGNFFSTPNNTGNQLTGNFGIQFNGTVNNNNGAVCAKATSVSLNFQFAIFRTSATTWTLAISANGSTLSQYTSGAFSQAFVRVSRNSTTGEIKFFESSDGFSWGQVGATISGITGDLFNSPAEYKIGAISSNQNIANSFLNNVQLFKDDTFTTPSQIFNPQLYNRSVSQTTIPSSTGETYSINIPSTDNALKAAIVDKTMIMGNGTSYGMQAPSFNLTGTAFTRYTVFRKFVNTLGSQIINELGSAIASNQGLYLAINGVADNEEFGINAGGLNNSRYTSNSVLMKVATSVVNINNADEATPYLINNSAQVLVAKDSNFNNTSTMNATGYNLLARNNASSLWANATVFADLIFDGEHGSTTRTNVYNILKTYFNLP